MKMVILTKWFGALYIVKMKICIVKVSRFFISITSEQLYQYLVIIKVQSSNLIACRRRIDELLLYLNMSRWAESRARHSQSANLASLWRSLVLYNNPLFKDISNPRFCKSWNFFLIVLLHVYKNFFPNSK